MGNRKGGTWWVGKALTSARAIPKHAPLVLHCPSGVYIFSP